MARDVVDLTPIESRDELVAWFAEGAKPKAQWRAGTEHEKFAFTSDTHEPVPYEGRRSIRSLLVGMQHLLGWEPIMDGPNIIGLADVTGGGDGSRVVVTGDITQVDLPKEGETIRKNDVIGTVESVKAVSDVYAPVSGKIVKVNTPLGDTPEYLSDDPYDEGWIIQIELTNEAELGELMDAAAYNDFVAEQEH